MARFFDAFQIGALIAFLLLFLGRTYHLWVVRGIQPIRIARGKSLPAAVLEGSLAIALPLWLYETVAFAWPLPWHVFPEPLYTPVLDHPLARGTGCVLLVSGIALFAGALLSFGDSWRVGIDPDTPGELVTRGVFAFSRNPIFLFMDAYALGIFLMNGRLLFGIFALLAPAALHYQIRLEERFLEEHYGDAYRAYRARTARYLTLKPSR